MPKASCYPRMSSLHSPFPTRPQLRPTSSNYYNTNPRSKIGGDLYGAHSALCRFYFLFFTFSFSSLIFCLYSFLRMKNCSFPCYSLLFCSF